MYIRDFIRDIVKQFPFLILANIILFLVADMVSAISVFSVAPLIDFTLNQNMEGVSFITKRVVSLFNYAGIHTSFTTFLILFLALNFLKSGFEIIVVNLILRTKYIVQKKFIVGTFDEMLNARWQFFGIRDTGKILNTFMNESVKACTAVAFLVRSIASVLELIVYLIIPFIISWQIASIAMASALVLGLPFMFLNKISYKLGTKETTLWNQIGSIIQENLSLAKIILGFGKQKESVDNLDHKYDIMRITTIRAQTLRESINLLFLPFALASLAIALISARQFNVPISELTVIAFSLWKGIPIIGKIISNNNLIANCYPSYEQVMQLQKMANEYRQKSGAKKFDSLNEEIIFENVSFKYEDNSNWGLNDINICIKAGKIIAIVGKSGTGKSSIIDLLMGFHEPSKGQIKVDGIALRDYDINSYRKKLGYVPQETVLFNASIRDNLMWANGNATDEEIIRACKIAHADSFIREFSEGYNTLVGDRGLRLSGGQVQRIALARAILRKPEVLILDEATSSLDSHSERIIQEAIYDIANETTVVIVSHRLSTIIHTDWIYVIEDGKVIEQGNYQSLKKGEGKFNEMIRLQEFSV